MPLGPLRPGGFFLAHLNQAAYNKPMTDLSLYQASLEGLKTQNALRGLPLWHLQPDGITAQGPNHQQAVAFCSNDYLGLSRHEALKQAAQEALVLYGTGSASARLIAGSSLLTQALEAELCAFKQSPAALVLGSGYQANLAVLQALALPNTVFLADKLNHASLVDGLRLAKATQASVRWQRYRHRDLNDLEARLKRIRQTHTGPLWLLSDSVFSMDGDWLDLALWLDLAERYGAFTLLDEAHGSGTFGPTGAGLAAAQGQSHRVTLQMGTFSKALGSYGAYITGPPVLIETVINRGRGFVYTTALPPAVLAANRAALQVVQTQRHHQQKLWANVATFYQALQAFPALAALINQETSVFSAQRFIVPLALGTNQRALAVSDALLAQGFWVPAVRPPTVPEGTARLRISLSAAHTLSQLQALALALNAALG